MKITSWSTKARIRMSRVVTLRLTLIALLSVSVSAFAQETRGTILGAVHDSHGGVIAGADVVATDSATNVSTKVSTNESGPLKFHISFPVLTTCRWKRKDLRRSSDKELS